MNSGITRRAITQQQKQPNEFVRTSTCLQSLGTSTRRTRSCFRRHPQKNPRVLWPGKPPDRQKYGILPPKEETPIDPGITSFMGGWSPNLRRQSMFEFHFLISVNSQLSPSSSGCQCLPTRSIFDMEKKTSPHGQYVSPTFQQRAAIRLSQCHQLETAHSAATVQRDAIHPP